MHLQIEKRMFIVNAIIYSNYYIVCKHVDNILP